MKNLFVVLSLCLCAWFGYGQSPNVVKLGTNNYKVRISPDNFRYERAAALRDGSTDGGWTACLNMVISNAGLNSTQDQIIALAGSGIRTSDPQDFMAAMNTSAPVAWGRSAHIYCEPVAIDEDALFDGLSTNRPPIAGIRSPTGGGVANVVVAMTYSIKYDAKGAETGINVATVTLVDPNAGALSQRILSWDDFVAAATVLYSVKVSAK